MIIRNACALALYCQHCGSIHVHDIPFFASAREAAIVCESCGHEKARLLRSPHGSIVIKAPCVVCGTENRFVYAFRRLRHIGLEKIYCATDRFELGYIGRRRRIEELMRFNQEGFEALHPHDGKNFIEKQRILLEALNRVHDMARAGDIVCPCGSEELTVDIHGSYIVLECEHCGSSCVLRAENAGDLKRLRFGVGLRAPSRA
ncbi:MAG: hypothetical protein IJ812_07470 [Schwartzia sp.]|nr:hypothetical protein [Schwartzia sp. (in: firmicutes)]MBR1886232.1 hypothetical protein [Schwartzia sp. (in: firmicutes)]